MATQRANAVPNRYNYDSVSNYTNLWTDDGASKQAAQDRRNVASELAKQYYDLATDFYEWGWGKLAL